MSCSGALQPRRRSAFEDRFDTTWVSRNGGSFAPSFEYCTEIPPKRREIVAQQTLINSVLVLGNNFTRTEDLHLR